MNKQAQVTMFIIVGLIILLGAVIGYVAYENELIFKPPEEQVSTELETQLRPFANVVSECQERIVNQGAKQLLRNGGYLENPSLLATISPLGNAAQVGTDLIPYWYYLDGQAYASEQPELQSDLPLSISSQLEDYVDQRLQDCIPWSNFPEYEFEIGELESDITFTRDQTTVVTNWPIQVQTLAGNKNYDAFTTSTDAPVKRLYDIAQEQLMILEAGRVPEENTIALLSIYATGRTALPPIAGSIGFGSEFKIWPIEPAKEELQEVISRMTDYLQVYGSNNADITYSETSGAITNLQFDSLLPSDPQQVGSLSDVTIEFYPGNQEPLYRVNGNRGAAIPKMLPAAPGIGAFVPRMTDTNFEHDISFPLVMSIIYDDYQLRVGYEANIQNTQAQEVGEEFVAESENLCYQTGGSEVTILVDRYDEKELEEPASVLYRCGPLICPVGQATNELQTQLPTCARGTIEVIADDLFSDAIAYSSEAGQEDTIQTVLYEPQEVTVDVRGLSLQKSNGEWNLSDTETPVGADVIFVRDGGDFTVQARSQETVELVPGVYDIIVIELTEFEPPFVIEEERICEGGTLITKETCVTLNETEFDSLPTVYYEQKGVELSDMTDTLVITTATIPTRRVSGSLEPIGIESLQDLGILEALFELQAENAVRFE